MLDGLAATGWLSHVCRIANQVVPGSRFPMVMILSNHKDLSRIGSRQLTCTALLRGIALRRDLIYAKLQCVKSK